MVAIINAIVRGSVFLCEKVGSEKGAEKGQPSLMFGVPQMGPGTPKSFFCRGSSENIQFFHDLAFWGKSQFFKITRPDKKLLLRSQGRPECPYIYRICKISEVLKFFWWLCFSEEITVPLCIRVFSRMPSCIRSSHSCTNTICEHENPQNSVFSICQPLLAKNREKGRRQVRESEIRPFRAQKQNRVGSPCQEGFSKVVSPHLFRVAERTRPNNKIAWGLPVGKGL